MKYAIFTDRNKQYKAEVGKELLLDGYRSNEDSKEKFEFNQVNILSNDDKIMVGEPFVNGAKVIGEYISEAKGVKINVRKYKAKSRYKKAIGHRAQYTRVKITDILSS